METLVLRVEVHTSIVIRNGNPNIASELCSACGLRFTQPFTNNYALQSTQSCRGINGISNVVDIMYVAPALPLLGLRRE